MCGLFGVVSYGDLSHDNINKLTKALGSASEDRGTDAGGISYVDNDNNVMFIKDKGAISKSGVFKFDLESKALMGHTRLGTGASELHNYNNHPFPSAISAYTMAHNGIISNDMLLEKEYALPDTKVMTDSYIVNRLIDNVHNGKLTMESIGAVSGLLQGSFNLTFQDKKSIWIVKHNNPMHILHIHELGVYAYASTKEILYEALEDFYNFTFLDMLVGRSGSAFGEFIPVVSGDIIRIHSDGTIERGKFTPKPYVYTTVGKGYNQLAKYYNPPYYSDYPLEDIAQYDAYDDEDWDKSVLDELYQDYYLINNGVEEEVVPSLIRDDKVYSKYLGRTIDLTDDNTLVMTPSGAFMETFKRKEFSFMMSNVFFGQLMARVSQMPEFREVRSIYNDNPVDKKMLAELLSLYIYLFYIKCVYKAENLKIMPSDLTMIEFNSEFPHGKALANELKKIVSSTTFNAYDEVRQLYIYLQVNIMYLYNYFINMDLDASMPF